MREKCFGNIQILHDPARALLPISAKCARKTPNADMATNKRKRNIQRAEIASLLMEK